MKKFNFFKVIVFASFLLIVVISCNKDKDDNTIINKPIVLSEKNMAVNKFIWSGMHSYYLWVDSIPNLSISNFKDEEAWKTYLNLYPDHEILFYSLLFKNKVVDKWSWIVEDYEVLENQFQGISKSMGYNFGLAQFSNSTELFGYVKYVLKGSPAYNAGLRRGDLFIGVNEQLLNESNYQDLLYGSDYYTLSMADISGNSIYPTDKRVTLSAAEIHENPIFFDNIFTINNVKIGYLVYNGFMTDYDIALNEVFKDFKDNGVQKLILDLRYNPGGSVMSAIYLASMIYGTDSNKIFMKTQYNTAYGNFIKDTYGDENFYARFTNVIEKTDKSPETPINTLNLNEVYIIATRSSASASELVINGLKPYMSVITIGTSTHGKYVGSKTIKDYDENGTLNPDHKWALQPIVMKAANSEGYTDYAKGLTPTILIEEDVRNFSELGNTDEPLLQKAINTILGIPQKSVQKSATDLLEYTIVADSKDLIPHGKDMYIDW